MAREAFEPSEGAEWLLPGHPMPCPEHMTDATKRVEAPVAFLAVYSVSLLKRCQLKLRSLSYLRDDCPAKLVPRKRHCIVMHCLARLLAKGAKPHLRNMCKIYKILTRYALREFKRCFTSSARAPSGVTLSGSAFGSARGLAQSAPKASQQPVAHSVRNLLKDRLLAVAMATTA